LEVQEELLVKAALVAWVVGAMLLDPVPSAARAAKAGYMAQPHLMETRRLLAVAAMAAPAEQAALAEQVAPAEQAAPEEQAALVLMCQLAVNSLLKAVTR